MRLSGLGIFGIISFLSYTAMVLFPPLAYPESVFGLFERFSLYSVVTFNAILGFYLLEGKFSTV